MRRAAIFVLLATFGASGPSCSATVRENVAPSKQPPSDTIDGGGDDDEIEPASDSGGTKDGGTVPPTEGGTYDAGNGEGGPYAGLQSLSDQALRDALHALVDNHISLGYDGARDVMLGISGQFDLSSGMLECIYTGKKVAPDGTRTPNGFNTEHTWPQSLGASSEPAKSDLHHLFPVDELANTARGNLPYADTDCGGSVCDFDLGGSRRGPIIGGSETVFQVRPARRGDIARAIFYFAVRYTLAIPNDEETALRDWNDTDLPDAIESARNDAIEGYQKNRNPFVDRPDFVAKISDF